MKTMLQSILAEHNVPTRTATKIVAEFARQRKNAAERAWKHANPGRVAKINARCRAKGGR